MTVQRLRDKQARGEPITIEDFVLDAIITGAQLKAGTGLKMQSISVVFSMLHCEGYIADLRYRWLITSGSARWRPRGLIEILSAILKSRKNI